MRIAVAVIVKTDSVKIPQAPIDRKIASPVVFVALERDTFAGLHASDSVRTAAEKWIETRILKGGRIDRVLCQHRHQSDDKRKLPIVGAGEIKADGAIAGRLCFVDLGIVGAEVRPTLIAQQLPRKDDVVRGHRRAVRKARFWIDGKGNE